MDDMIEDYEKTYRSIVCRMYQLKKELREKDDFLLTGERERLIARIDMLLQERFEICDVLNELRKHQ